MKVDLFDIYRKNSSDKNLVEFPLKTFKIDPYNG